MNTKTTESDIKPVPMMAALIVAAFIGLFSETALNMAFTNIMTEFSVESSDVQWLTTGYLLVLGILVPVSALLLQWFTTRQLFVTSLLFSIIGSIVAAITPNFEILLFARVIQAIGTALLLPLMTNTILVIFPPNKRGAAMGMMGLVIMFAPAVGPTFSGLIVDKLSWHWIFWISTVLLLFALVLGLLFLRNVSTITKPKIDILSIVLSTIGFGGIVYGFSAAGEGAGEWLQKGVLLPIVIGAISLTLFSIRQFKMEQPMINLRVFKFSMFTLGVIMVFAAMMLILASAILLPLYLKGSLLLTAFTAGLVLLPGGLVNGLMSPFAGTLFDRYGPRFLVIPGFIMTTITTFFLSDITTTTSTTIIIILHTCLFIGIALIMMPAQTNGLNQLPPAFYPDGSAVMNTLSQIAGAIGTAVAVSIMAAGQEDYNTNLKGMPNAETMAEALTAGIQNAFLFALIASIIGLIVSLFVKRV